jgi:hypothetical protein
MTKTENTAVNRLIEQAHSRPLDADDALFSSPPPRKSLPRPFPNRITPVDEPAPMPRHRIPSSTQTQLTAAPPAAKIARPSDLEDSGLLEVDDADDDDDMPMTVAEPAAVVAAAGAPVRLADIKPMSDESTWYEESVAVDRVDEAQLGTRFVRRTSRTKSVLLLCGAFLTGLVATAYIAWPSRAPSVEPEAPTPAASVKPARAATVVEPAVVPPAVDTTAAAPAVVEPVEPAVVAPAVVAPAEPAVVVPAEPAKLAVELDSDPSGATVLLVDGATTITLGSTPLSHELDASRSYELMFTMSGHKSALVTVDPAKSQRVNVDLASATATAAPRAAEDAVAVAEPAPPAAPAVAKTTTRPARAKPEPKPAAKPAAKAAARPAARPARVANADPPKAAGGKGMLMIGSKPPCEIFVDGKATRLKTPQRELKLTPGPHKITLVNKEHRITETFTVDVKAGASTKVVKDLTRRMK